MPLDVSAGRTPKGHDIVRTHTHGEVQEIDVTKMMSAIGPGGAFPSWPMLSMVETGTEFTLDARRAFARMGEGQSAQATSPVAIVINSAPLRAIVNFIVKASQVVGRNQGNIKFFKTEPEALAWLDEQIEASRAATPR